jgi:uncharacterized membrane protein
MFGFLGCRQSLVGLLLMTGFVIFGLYSIIELFWRAALAVLVVLVFIRILTALERHHRERAGLERRADRRALPQPTAHRDRY